MKELQSPSENQLLSKIKLPSRIVIKEGTCGVQQDSIKRQKSNSCRADWKSPVVQQGPRDLGMQQFRGGFEELGALGSKRCLKYIREKVWARRTEGTVNFLHFFMLLHHSGAQGMCESPPVRHLVLGGGTDKEHPSEPRVFEAEMLEQSTFKWKSNRCT